MHVLHEVHSSYGLLGKVVATVTDNASDFAKAFKVYQQPYSDTEEEDETTEDEEVTFTDLSEILAELTGGE